ncbi:MAG TPA: hypothetical protein VMB22_06205 [Verrucomicrobiae bacterium]|nr:hypothetical protein [Verrucomicrobiae bacterium]
MVFENGATLKLLKVDYGEHHAAPAGGGRTFSTTNDELVVWIRKDHKPGDWLNTQFYVYDEAGTVCVPFVGRGGTAGSWQGSFEIQGIRFDAFPRRQEKFYVTLQYELRSSDNGQTMASEKFVVSNPARGKSFPQWTPEPLPDTQSDGDLSVTLTKLISGVPMPFNRGDTDPDDVMNKGVQAVFHVERDDQAVQNWQPVSVQTSDATGNSISGVVVQNNWQDGDDAVFYQYGLWPDEPAWKVRVEFSRQSDFTDDELWTVPNIPFQPGRQQELWSRQAPTGSPFAETDLNGYHVKIFPVKQFTDAGPNQNPQGELLIQTEPPLPAGMRLTLVKLTDNQADDIRHLDYNFPGNNITGYRYGLTDINGLTNLNLTLALHKSRFVEFMVKPEQAPAAAEAAQ